MALLPSNEGYVSNAVVIVSAQAVIVFDALGTPALAAELVRQIRTISKLPITHAITSHYHADHVYGLQVFEQLGAQIIAPIGAPEYFELDIAQNRLEERRISLSPWVDDNTYLVIPDSLVEADLVIESGDVRLHAINIGAAHSRGDMTLLVEPDQVLLIGDIILKAVFRLSELVIPAPGCKPWKN